MNYPTSDINPRLLILRVGDWGLDAGCRNRIDGTGSSDGVETLLSAAEYLAKLSAFQHIALWMAVLCVVTFTGGPLNAEMVKVHRQKTEREERILRNLGLDEATLARNRAQMRPETVKERLSGKYAFDLHPPFTPGQIGNLLWTLRVVKEGTARKEARLGRDPFAASDLQYLYGQRDLVENMLKLAGKKVEEMAPPMPRYTRPVGPTHKEVKLTPRLPRYARIVRPNVGEIRTFDLVNPFVASC